MPDATGLELLAGDLREIMGAQIKPVHAAPRPGEVRHSQASIDAARADLGYEPRVSFVDGLTETVEWYRSNRAWWEPLKERAHLG